MRTIYKYPFQVSEDVEISLPHNAEILSVQKEGGSPIGWLTLWALVDTLVGSDARHLRVLGTGHDAGSIDERDLDDQLVWRYLATVQEADGALVWHVFERT